MSVKKFTTKQIAAAVAARNHANGGAPEKVVTAFFPDRVTVSGLELQPLTLATYMLLEKINSPLLLAECEAKVEDVLRAAAILALPLTEVRKLVSLGSGALDDAVFEFAQKIPLAELKSLGEKISAHIAAAFNTAIAGSGDSGLGERQSPAAGLAGS